jgi:hypothetical protein
VYIWSKFWLFDFSTYKMKTYFETNRVIDFMLVYSVLYSASLHIFSGSAIVDLWLWSATRTMVVDFIFGLGRRLVPDDAFLSHGCSKLWDVIGVLHREVGGSELLIVWQRLAKRWLAPSFVVIVIDNVVFRSWLYNFQA